VVEAAENAGQGSAHGEEEDQGGVTVVTRVTVQVNLHVNQKPAQTFVFPLHILMLARG